MVRGWSIRARHIPCRLTSLQISSLGQVKFCLRVASPSRDCLSPSGWSVEHRLLRNQVYLQVPGIVSSVPDLLTLNTVALSMDWGGLTAFAFPPHQILFPVLRSSRDDNLLSTAGAPLWPKQPESYCFNNLQWDFLWSCLLGEDVESAPVGCVLSVQAHCLIASAQARFSLNA